MHLFLLQILVSSKIN